MKYTILFHLLCLATTLHAQSTHVLKGILLDENTEEALPYANIHILHSSKGVISNETGYFALNISGLKTTDTIRFQYIGYKPVDYALHQLDSFSVIYLEESITNIGETIIFGETPDAEFIVEQILVNKRKNYPISTSKKKLFIRERNNYDVNEIKIAHKKSSLTDIGPGLINEIEEVIPRHYTGYTDFLGYIYTKEDSFEIKVEPIRTIRLEEELSKQSQLTSSLENIFKEPKTDEYWNLKTGIISGKIDLEKEEDSTQQLTLKEGEEKLLHHNYKIKRLLHYASLNNEDDWDFLHHSNRYHFTLTGETRVDGEDAYIIDFMPKRKGVFSGRIYVSMQSYALIRADYQYAPEKSQSDFHLLGIGYSENEFHGSIYFEKEDSTYTLKYLSKRTGSEYHFNRKLSLLKKKKRRFFDKKLHELKVKLDFAGEEEKSAELLVLDKSFIDTHSYKQFTEEKVMKIQYVNQFDETLWEDVSIIEPTKQMREYQKRK